MGLNLSAPICTTGYGYLGLNLLRAFEKLGAEPALFPIGPIEAAPEHHELIRRAYNRQAEFRATAPSLRVWHQYALAERVGKGKMAAFPVFELDRFTPGELHHLHAQDVVFATSAWAEGVLRKNGVENVVRAPLGVDRDVFRPRPLPSLPYLHFLNMGKWELRKGHDVLIKAFARAFRPGDRVRLTLHCHNPVVPGDAARREAYNREWATFAKSTPMGPQTDISTGRLATTAEVAALMEKAHVGVFPARAEGWNMEAAEMLAMGRHVVLSDCTAHQEYGGTSGATLFEAGPLEPAHDGVWFFADNPNWQGSPGRWHSMGEEQVKAVASSMAALYELWRGGGEEALSVGRPEWPDGLAWENTARIILGAL